jgi:amino acid permease
MADLTGNHAHGTQHDAFLADNDPVQRRSVAKERKLSLGAKHLGEDGGHNSADDLLTAMGYKAELVRSRSTLQVAFMSFVLAAIPYGLATTMYYPLVGGGPANIIWGWVAVSLIILCVAASLGEITSVYPTAGGVYYQTWMLSAPSYRKIASWICGWNFVVGNITITLAVNFGTALFLGACINVFEVEEGVGVFAAEPYQIYLIFVGITLLCNIVSSLGNKWLPLLDVREYSSHKHLALRLTSNSRHSPSSGHLLA